MNDEMELSWLPWVTERERKDFVQAARYARLLPLAYVKIPLINKIPGWRLSHYNFRFPVELGVIEWLHDKYADEGSPFSRLMRKMVTVTHLRGQHQAG
jgi:hypothetical protein